MCNKRVGRWISRDSELFNISDITQSSDHAKSSSISQLIKGQSRDLQKLFKYFNGATTFAFNTPLLAAVLPVIFVLHSKDLYVVVLLLFNLQLSTISLASSFTSSFIYIFLI